MQSKHSNSSHSTHRSNADKTIEEHATTVSAYNQSIRQSTDPREQASLRKKRDEANHALEEFKKQSSSASHKSNKEKVSSKSYTHENMNPNHPSHAVSQYPSAGNLDQASQVDLAIVFDATGSMTRYIENTKSKINEIIKTCKALYPSSEFRIAVVVYRDFEQGDDNTIVQSFTKNVSDIENFLKHIRVVGNFDDPEDINGGFRKVVDELEWKSFTRVLIHIGDSPCHGSRFHDSSMKDYYTQYQTLDRNWDEIFNKMKARGIDYHFLRLGPRTDVMMAEFKKIWNSLGTVSRSSVSKGRKVSIYEHEMSVDSEKLVSEVVGSIRISIKASQKHLTDMNTSALIGSKKLSDAEARSAHSQMMKNIL